MDGANEGESVGDRMAGLMRNIRQRQASITERTEESVRLGYEQMDNGFRALKEMVTVVFEIVLRLPGLLLLELLWRYQDLSFDVIPDDVIKEGLSYVDIRTMLDFVHRRNLDEFAAIILSYFVIFLSIMFLTLPFTRLLRMYAHFLSLFLFGVAYRMSARYMELELEHEPKEEVLTLDGLQQLERHGFHFLSQSLLAVIQAALLDLEDFYRLAPACFTLPIVARMCGHPLDKLHQAHNYASTATMVLIATYILYRAPALLHSAKTALRQLKAVFMVHGLAEGARVVWRRLRLVELMTFTWCTMFLMVLYVELIDKGHSWSEVGRILLVGVAETTNTPITLLALAISVSYVCKWIAELTKLVTGGTRSHGHVLAHSGYTEAFSVLILCIQTGYLGMQKEQKTLMLGLTLYIVISALLHSLYEIIEIVLLNLPSAPGATRARHVRCVAIAAALVVVPFVTTRTMLAVLPIDIFSAILIANNSTVATHALGCIIKYCVLMIEAKSIEPWERSDDLTFYCDCTNKAIELVSANVVFWFGCWHIVYRHFSVSSLAILVFHVVVNIYRRGEQTLIFIRSRNAAVKNINRLSKAGQEQLKEREDLCAICFIEMREEARITPCGHFFHGPCLRKWLAVKMVCPLCYAEMRDDEHRGGVATTTTSTSSEASPPTTTTTSTSEDVRQRRRDQNRADEEVDDDDVVRVHPPPPPTHRREGEIFDWDDLFGGLRGARRNRDEQRIHGARDMWPLLVDNFSDAYESDSSASNAESELTIDSEHY